MLRRDYELKQKQKKQNLNFFVTFRIIKTI